MYFSDESQVEAAFGKYQGSDLGGSEILVDYTGDKSQTVPAKSSRRGRNSGGENGLYSIAHEIVHLIVRQ